jgi:outer membrane receptor protein involved in Fe transport/outer membrane protein assembly factor BamD (BamD/ComL family)
MRVRLASFAAVTLAVLAFSAEVRADDRTEARRHFKSGMALIAKGKYQQGIAELEKANEILPHPNVTFNIAQAHGKAGNIEEAVAAYRRYLASDPPDRAEVVIVVEQLEQKLGKDKASGAAAEEGKQRFRTGMDLISKGKYDEGIRELEKANEILPHPNVTFNIARAQAEAGKLDKAIASYRSYLASNPPDRKQVEQIVAQLEERAAEQRAAQPTTAPGAGGAGPGVPEPAAKEQPFAGTGTATTTKSDASSIVGAAREEDVYRETIVTASRGAQSPLDSPNSTTIITRQDIRLSGITRIPELLRRAAGLDVMQVTGGDSAVSMRGFNSRLSPRTLVLVNGRSVYNDFLGSTFWESLSIDVDQIERIEIVRGPGSALYGADAFAGVINIIPIAPGEGKGGVRVGYGDHQQGYGSIWASGREGDFAYRASAGYTRYPRWTREIGDQRDDLVLSRADQDLGAQNVRLDVRTTQRLGQKREIQLGGGFARSELDFYGVGPFNDFHLEADNMDVTAAFRSEHVNARVYWARLDALAQTNANYVGHTLYDTRPVQNSLDGELEVVNTFNAPEALRHEVHIGLGYRLKNIEWSYLVDDPPVEHHGAAFLQDSIQIGKAFTFVGSGRLDYVPYLKRVIASPRGSIIVKPSDRQAIRLSGSTAFRKPTFLESYLDLPIQLSLPGAELISASLREDIPDFVLEPEQIITGEASYLNQLSDLFEFELTAYYNRITDLIVLAEPRVISLSNKADGFGGLNPETGRYSVAFGGWDNQCDTYNVIGGEAGARVYPVEGLDVFANYAINVSQQDRPDGCAVPEDRRTSRHKVNAGIQVRTKPGVNGEISFHYQSAQEWGEQVATATGIETQVFPLPAYTLLNGRLGYRFYKDRAEVSATVFNALAGITSDEAPQMHPFGNRVGRRFMGFFTYSL